MAKALFKSFLLVVDDFYKDPYKVYEYAKGLNYRKLTTATGYRTKEIYHEKGIKKRLENLLSIKILNWGKENHENGVFFLAFSGGHRKETPGIHTDPLLNDITVVVYLTPGIPDDCGTSFWKHKATGLWHEPSDLEAKQLHIPLNALRIKMNEECLKKKNWEEQNRIAYKFNRMIAFPSALYHSGSKHFGKDIENGRIIQTFRIEVDWDTRC